MPTTKPRYIKRLTNNLKKFWNKSILNKILIVIIGIVFFVVLLMYSIGFWYIQSDKNTPANYGVSFIPDYAKSLGLDPRQTMDALININVKEFRLVSYWSDIEPSQGTYNFTDLDWQFKKAEVAHAKIILTLGLRQPRWPECHAPKWVNTNAPSSEWINEIKNYESRVVERYKNSPSLYEYQLENEYFLKGFGKCTNFDRNRLVSEYTLVKSLDPNHKIIVGLSNNTLGFPINQPHPDIYGISVYKRVWDAAFTHRYVEYPYPAWYYAFLAGVQKIYHQTPMIISEMQAESWPPNGKSINEISINEQNKSLNPKRLEGRFKYAKNTGMKQLIMWGAEYWYYRDQVLHDPSLWNVAKQQFN